MSKTNKNKVSIQKVDSLIRKGKIITALVRLQKNGHFSSFKGIIRERLKSSDGTYYVRAQNFLGHEREDGTFWQNIRLDNIISLKD